MALDAGSTVRHAAVIARLGERLKSAAGWAARLFTPVRNWWSRTAIARYISGTLLRRILVSNLLGLAVLLGGVLYLSATHSWLLDAKRQSLQKPGQIIASAIGENARSDLFTGSEIGRAHV